MSAPITVHLVDASPYLFRAFFALPEGIRDPSGRTVAAVHGFAAFLLRLIADEEPTHLGVAFDDSLSVSFRNEIYPEYKGQREPPPPELVDQLADSRRVATALGAATFCEQGYEADDLIGTLCTRLETRGRAAVVVTSDKDLCQLVGPTVELLDFARGRRFDAPAVREKFGVRPDQLVDLLSLAGDSVDNIPGVAGIGMKTAARLLQRFDDLEEIYANLDQVATLPIRGARAVRDRLAAGDRTAALSKRLATIARDAPVEADAVELEYRGADRTAVEELFGRLGFGGLGERISRWAADDGAGGLP